jgi:hypothetical protein
MPFATLIVAGSADGVWRWGARRIPSRRTRRVQLAARAAIVLAIGGLALAAGPQWVRGNEDQMTNDDQAAGRSAVEWITRHVDHRSEIVVDDTVWVDLVERGFSPQRTVWFYKLDLDPGIPGDWRQVDYVLRSNIMEGNAKDLPHTQALLDNSRAVATFTAGTERMEVRQVVPPPAWRQHSATEQARVQ